MYWCWLCGDDATGFLALKDNKRHLDKLNSSFQSELMLIADQGHVEEAGNLQG